MENSTPLQQKKPRYDYLDIAKAIAIFCVIWGHAASGSDNVFYRSVLYTFHMPLFFMVSGILIRIESPEAYTLKGWGAFLKKNAAALLVPYFLWGLIYSNFSLDACLNLLYGSYQGVKSVSPIGALWFMPCFFLVRVESRLIMQIASKIKLPDKPVVLVFAIIAFAIGFLLPNIPEYGYPWSFNISFVALGFVLLSYLAKDFLQKLENGRTGITLAFLVAFGVIFTCGTFLRAGELELVCFYNGNYGNLFRMFRNAISGCGFVFVLSVLIAKIGKRVPESKVYNGILWFGQNTVGIFFLHVPFIRQFSMPLLSYIGISTAPWMDALIGTCITVPICVLLTILIKRFLPQLFGDFRLVQKHSGKI